MDSTIAGILLVDGLTNAAVYALLGLATVLVFAVTRVIFIPQGEFVAFGALTLAMFQTGATPGTVWLLLLLAGIVAILDAWHGVRERQPLRRWGLRSLRILAPALVIAGVSWWAAPMKLPMVLQAALSALLVTALGPLVYRLAYRSLADASVLVLLIVSVGVHYALTGLSLLFFGAEGFRNPSFWSERFSLGAVAISGQAIIIVLTSLALIALLWLFFEHTLHGKALRATAVNRLGARLMGISTHAAGSITFALAAFISALSGLLIGSTTTVFYDTGFLIGLKGFVAAVVGGLTSYPGAALGAVLVGVIESFGSFWASAFKEVIVFTFLLPVLLARSWRDPGHE